MDLVADITIWSNTGQKHTYHILGNRDDEAPYFEITQSEPVIGEVASATSFDEAISEITNSLFFNEVGL